MSRRGYRTVLTLHFINGWVVQKMPNTFAERHMWEACAVDDQDYLIEKHGFASLKAARTYCGANNPPTKAKPVDAETRRARLTVTAIMSQHLPD